MRIDASTDGGRSQIDLAEQAHQFVGTPNVLTHCGGEGSKFLAKSHGNSILQLGPSHLDDVLELVALGAQRGAKVFHGPGEVTVAQEESQPYGSWIDVVGRLREVDVIVGMQVLVLPLGISQD